MEIVIAHQYVRKMCAGSIPRGSNLDRTSAPKNCDDINRSELVHRSISLGKLTQRFAQYRPGVGDIAGEADDGSLHERKKPLGNLAVNVFRAAALDGEPQSE